MKRYLLPDGYRQFKANLHTHTIYSDGNLTPKEIKDLYKRHGYSAVAFTDHDILVPHQELADDEFIPLNGYEMEITEPGDDFDLVHCCHLCFIAKDKNNITPVCLHHSNYMFGGAMSHFGEMAPFEGDYVREYTPQCINDIIAKAKKSGFFVTYNHPVWSMENYPLYSKYEGMDAMEMFNYLSLVGGFEESNHSVYDDFLRQGKRLFCIAADDCHDSFPEGDPQFDSCGAWTMICAPSLTYENLTSALEKGEMYASMGPEITSLYIEDGTIHLSCTDAKSISFSTGTRHTACIAAQSGKTVCEASFSLHPTDVYVRAVVTGEDGTKAYTRAYFTEEF